MNELFAFYKSKSIPTTAWLLIRTPEIRYTYETHKRAWRKVCEAAGFWDKAASKPTRLLHDFRRTGVRNLVRSGTSERTAPQISGFKTRSVFDRYDIQDERDILDAAKKLSEYEHYAATNSTDYGRRNHAATDHASDGFDADPKHSGSRFDADKLRCQASRDLAGQLVYADLEKFERV